MANSKERFEDWKIFENRLELLKDGVHLESNVRATIPKLDVLVFVTAALDAYVGAGYWTAADAVALTKVVFEESRALRREALERELEADA